MSPQSTPGRVLHTGQAIADIVMRIPALPALGEDVFATGTQIAAGGGFNVMAAARRDGAEVVYLGLVGDGPFGEVVSAALAAEGVVRAHPPLAGIDTGFSVAMVDDGAERTFVTSPGAEGHIGLDDLRRVEPGTGDVICVSGYSFVHEHNAAALKDWIPQLAEDTTVIVDPSPMIAALDDEAWQLLCSRATVWTLNRREAELAVLRCMGPAGMKESGAEVDAAELAGALSARVAAHVVVRDGAAGTYLAHDGAPVECIPAYPVTAVDTNGAGDAHTGVLAAALARGVGMHEAVHRANIAAAIAVSRFGPATSPTAAEIDEVLTNL